MGKREMGYIQRCVRERDGIYIAMGEREMGYIQRWVRERWDIYSDG